MLKKSIFALAAFLLAPLSASASPEQDALNAINAAHAQVDALAVVKSPSSTNVQSAQGDISKLGPYFDNVVKALQALNLDASSKLLSASIQVKADVLNVGKVNSIDLSAILSTCQGLSTDVGSWEGYRSTLVTLLQQRVDAQTLSQAQSFVNQVAPTVTPVPGTAGGGGVNAPTPAPIFSPVIPTTAPTLPPIVGTAPTPTPITAPVGGVIPGGWTPPPPTAVPTPVPGLSAVPTVVPMPQTQLRAPLPLVVGHNGQRLWTGNVRANSVSVMDLHSQRFVAEIAVGSQPQALGVDDSDDNVVVANFASNNVSILDGRADKVLKTIAVASGPQEVVVTHAGKAYVMCQDGKAVAVIDLKLHLLLKSIKLSSRPGHLDQPNSSQDIYVTLPDEDSVAVIDTGFDDVVATIKE